MGAYNQIEIYPNSDVSNEVEFLQRIEKLLELSTITKSDKKQLIESIKLITDENDKYYEYKRTKIIFDLEHQNAIEWHIDIFNWSNQNLNYEIRLAVDSESLLHGEYPNIHYKRDIITEIEYIMLQINHQKENELILFTDEASEGEFATELEGKVSEINFLFDMAIIPINMKWNMNQDKYHLIEKINEQGKYRSKHIYMNQINKDCN